YTDAYNLLCETYYRSAEFAVLKGDLSMATCDLQQLAKINIHYKETFQRLEEMFVQLVNKAMWDLAAQLVVTLHDLSTLMRQQLDNTNELKAAVEAIIGFDLL